MDSLSKSNYKPEIVTSWDDGYALDLKLASMLKKYPKLPAVFYIIVDMVGKEGYLTWEQIKDLDHQGFEIGSHTMTHPSDLKFLNDEDLHYEIQTSKDLLQAALGHPVSKFCYPRGRSDERVREFVINAEYVEARGTGEVGITKVTDFYNKPGTLHMFQREGYKGADVFEYSKALIDKVFEQGFGYVNIWGHSKEIHTNKFWDVTERVLEYANSKL